ncbi:MAG TPA: hypothetical protein V6D28_00830 [Leptolyngbyaceae cyanobacterium]
MTISILSSKIGNINELRTQVKYMSDFNITLKPVYSCPASDLPKGVQLPQGWVLSWHQVDTNGKLQSLVAEIGRDHNIVINEKLKDDLER